MDAESDWPEPRWRDLSRRRTARAVLRVFAVWVAATVIAGAGVAAGLAPPNASILPVLVLWMPVRASLRRHALPRQPIVTGPDGAEAAAPGELRVALDRTVPRAVFVQALGLFMYYPFMAIYGALAGWDACAGLVAAAVALGTLTLAFRVILQGGVELMAAAPVSHPGTRASFRVTMTDGAERLSDARFLLRCVRPWTTPTGGRAGAKRKPRLETALALSPVVCAGTGPGPREPVDVAFDIPADAPVSDFALKNPTWWELIVIGDTRWGQVTERFLVPVRPDAEA